MTIIFVCTAVILFIFRLSGTFGETTKPSISAQDALWLGERMYREGILPSGEPMQSYVKGDIPVAGTAFTCVSCHLRSGLGSVEGGIVTPPTNSSKLFQPVQVLYRGIQQKYFSLPPRRPAYTDVSLAEVLRSGLNPSGEILNDVMPRYVLTDEDMAILISYLKSLSSDFSSGYSANTLRFATVITEDVNPKDRDAMLAALEHFITIKNNTARFYETKVDGRARPLAGSMMASKDLAYLRLSLSRWVLKGSPDTWRSQLEAYYRKEPVFALIGGISNSKWETIHKFSEDNQIPCLFPITDFPVISETDWYTLYFSKGYYQEGEAAARYLNSREDVFKGRAIVQIVRDSREGHALSDGFKKTWQDFGHPPPLTITLKPQQALTKEFLKQAMDKEKPASVILWVGPEALPELEALADISSRPEIIFVSSQYLRKNIWTLPEKIRKFTYITYPFTFSRYETKASMAAAMGGLPVQDDVQQTLSLKNIPIKGNEQKISNLTNSLIQILTMTLMDMKGNYYRDNFFDVISMVADQQSQVYGRLSFGPGQRYASKGCYIVQLTEGPTPELIKRSEWIIH